MRGMGWRRWRGSRAMSCGSLCVRMSDGVPGVFSFVFLYAEKQASIEAHTYMILKYQSISQTPLPPPALQQLSSAVLTGINHKICRIAPCI